MTLLETILIIYILLSWFLIIMFMFLPELSIKCFKLVFSIACPPLIIVFIGELIIKKMKERKKKQKNNEVLGNE